MAKKQEISARSSAAEYLTYITATGEGGVEAIYADENVWLTQKMMGVLYDVATNTINYHLHKLYKDGEIEENEVIRKFQITANDGKDYNAMHYNLKAIIAVGNKVDSPKAVQFRKWANTIIEEYTIKGYAMDDERLKKGGSILTKEYFEQLLERIREIRLSERKFYQKITDIYATSIDYDSKANETKRFFAAVQNKLHFAVHGNTAAEVIYNRADANKTHMGLTSWEGSPTSKIHKYDVSIAKNYLTEDELKILTRIVTAYLDFAESMALRNIPMTMADWEIRLDGFLTLMDHEVLKDKGRISAEEAKLHAETEFEKYRIIQDRLFQSDFDKFIELEGTAKEIEGTSNKS